MPTATFSAYFIDETAKRELNLLVNWDFDEGAPFTFVVEEILDQEADEYLDEESPESKAYIESINEQIIDFLCNEGEDLAIKSGNVVGDDHSDYGDYLNDQRRDR